MAIVGSTIINITARDSEMLARSLASCEAERVIVNAVRRSVGPATHQERVRRAAHNRAGAALNRACECFERDDFVLGYFWLRVQGRYLALSCRLRSGARRFNHAR